MDQYIVLIGDLVGSKDLNKRKRENCQSILKGIIERINNDKSSSIRSPLTITLGDEFQAVYDELSTVLEDSWSVLAALHPVGVRFSIGIGQIYTPINSEQALGMDGPAFHVAREGMDQLKSSGRIYNVEIGSPSDRAGEIVSLVDLVNHTLHFLSNELKLWKKTRLQILVMHQKGEPVKNVAEKLDISESAVYKNRGEGDLDLILKLKESIGENINRIL